MDKEKFLQLASKINDGSATDADVALYNACISYFENENIVWDEELMGNKELIENEISQRINKHINYPIADGNIRSMYVRIASAAAVLCLITFTIFYVYQYKQLNKSVAKTKAPGSRSTDINPGGSKALLTLADGTSIDLNSIPAGALIHQFNTELSKTADGQLLYNVSNKYTDPQNSITAYNTLSTPRGGQYQIVLPDGSKVWLNSVSSLRFPVAFAKNKRKVELSGEAYFEVAKNKNAPFIISVNKHEIEVIGTSFNISAYSVKTTKTTLIAGLVKVKKGSNSRIIKPGEKAIVNELIEVSDADTEQDVAWKNGLMSFNNEDIRSIMLQVSRWYDVEVVYAGKVPERKFTGEITRNAKLSELLKILELSDINFKIDDRRIIISP